MSSQAVPALSVAGLVFKSVLDDSVKICLYDPYCLYLNYEVSLQFCWHPANPAVFYFYSDISLQSWQQRTTVLRRK